MVITSKEDICNLALVKNGGKEITDINDTTNPNAILMKRLYDATLWFLLTETFWMFATDRINAVVVGGGTVDIADLTEWAVYTGYAFGATTKETTGTDNVYFCITDHSEWEASQYYKVGNYVFYGTDVYICILNNLSSSDILPTNETYWTLVCTSANTDPKNGANRATFWQELTVSDGGVYNIDIVENIWSTWGLDYIYQVPPDMIRLIGWSKPGTTVRQEGGYLLTDSSGLGILYNYFNENIAQYPAHFVQTFVDKLRADSCQKLTGSNSKTVYWTEYWEDRSLPNAKAIDSQGQSSVSVKKNAWTNAKYNGFPADGKRKIYYR